MNQWTRNLFKSHLIWAIPVALAAAKRWRLVSSFLATGLILGVVSFSVVGSTGVREWTSLVLSPSVDYRAETMGNIRALGLHFGRTVSAGAKF